MEELEKIFGKDWINSILEIDKLQEKLRGEQSRLDSIIADIHHIIELYPKRYYKRKLYKTLEDTLIERREVKARLNFITTNVGIIKSFAKMVCNISKYTSSERKYKLRVLNERDFSYSKEDIW